MCDGGIPLTARLPWWERVQQPDGPLPLVWTAESGDHSLTWCWDDTFQCWAAPMQGGLWSGFWTPCAFASFALGSATSSVYDLLPSPLVRQGERGYMHEIGMGSTPLPVPGTVAADGLNGGLDTVARCPEQWTIRMTLGGGRRHTDATCTCNNDNDTERPKVHALVALFSAETQPVLIRRCNRMGGLFLLQNTKSAIHIDGQGGPSSCFNFRFSNTIPFSLFQDRLGSIQTDFFHQWKWVRCYVGLGYSLGYRRNDETHFLSLLAALEIVMHNFTEMEEMDNHTDDEDDGSDRNVNGSDRNVNGDHHKHPQMNVRLILKVGEDPLTSMLATGDECPSPSVTDDVDDWEVITTPRRNMQ